MGLTPRPCREAAKLAPIVASEPVVSMKDDYRGPARAGAPGKLLGDRGTARSQMDVEGHPFQTFSDFQQRVFHMVFGTEAKAQSMNVVSPKHRDIACGRISDGPRRAASAPRERFAHGPQNRPYRRLEQQ